eukprot:gene9322-9487_t
MLAMQVASKAAQDVPPPQRHIQFAQQLLTGMADFLVIALPAAVQYQHDLAGGDSSTRAAAALVAAGGADQQCPGLLAAADVGALLSLTLAACHTYHLKQCTAVLDWIQVLVQESYRGGRQAHGVSHLQGQQGPLEGFAGNSPGGDGAGSRSSLSTTLMAVRQRLEGGAGAQVVLALLLAAAGAMPPDVVLPISFCLHSVWLSVGRQLFEAWLGAAVLQLAPEGAPWQRQRHTAKITFISDLTDSTCLTDTTRFKRLLKTFCGGKKKGSGRPG